MTAVDMSPRGKKGTYRLAPLDLEHPEAPYTHLRALPDCVAILSPDFPANAAHGPSRMD
ncbi:hypothetical protein ACVK00_004581 [Burkholderia sp. PvR073]